MICVVLFLGTADGEYICHTRERCHPGLYRTPGTCISVGTPRQRGLRRDGTLVVLTGVAVPSEGPRDHAGEYSPSWTHQVGRPEVSPFSLGPTPRARIPITTLA